MSQANYTELEISERAPGTENSRVPARQRRRRRIAWTGGLLLAALVAVAVAHALWRTETSQAAPPPPPQVTISRPLRQTVAASTGFLGQFSAVDRVELRAQVGGTLTEIHFKDGQIVHKGDLLFVIDPRPYEIRLDQARRAAPAAQAAAGAGQTAALARATLKQHRFWVRGERR